MAKHGRLVGVVVLAILICVFLSRFSWDEPQQVYMIIPDGDGGSSTTSEQAHVADTWQSWRVAYKNGAILNYASSKKSFSWAFQLSSPSNSNPLYIELTVPIQFLIQLPKGSTLPLTTNIPAWYYAILVRQTLSVSLNGQVVGTVYPSNYPDLVLTYTSFDSPGKVANFKFYILLSGSSPVQSLIPPLDLRNKVPSQGVFNLRVDVLQSWDLAKYCNPGGRICGALSHNDLGIQYKLDFSIDLAQMTTPISYMLPTQTFAGTVITTAGRVTIIVTQIVPSISTVTTGQGWTATVQGSGTTYITTITDTVPTPPSLCTMIPWLCDFLDWINGSTWGVPNWLFVVAAFLIVLWILAKLLAPKVQVGG